jgi:hypothetical protein
METYIVCDLKRFLVNQTFIGPVIVQAFKMQASSARLHAKARSYMESWLPVLELSLTVGAIPLNSLASNPK